jgi:hypothetical protein
MAEVCENDAIQRLMYLGGFREELRTFLMEQKQQAPEISDELTDDSESGTTLLGADSNDRLAVPERSPVAHLRACDC